MSESEVELGNNKKVVVCNYKRALGKGKSIMVQDVVDVNKKKPVLPRSTGIVIR